MGLKEVLDKVQDRGKKKRDAEERTAKAEAERILRESSIKKKKIIENTMVEVTKAVERLKNQEFSRVDLENKRNRLIMEKALLDEVLKKAKYRIMNLPEAKNRVLMQKLITKHKSKGEIIFSSKKQESMVRALAVPLKYGGNIDCLGGIVIQNADGSVRFDFRYETILKAVADETLKEVARILFNEESGIPE